MDNFISAIIVLIIAILLDALIALPVMWIWNSIMPSVLEGAKQIGWSTAWMLMIMISLFTIRVNDN